MKLSKDHCPTSEKDKPEMSNVPYSPIVRRLMYAMICTKPDIPWSCELILVKSW